MPGSHAERDDIGDVIAHVADRAATEIHERNKPGAALALQGRVVKADPRGGVLLGVTFVQLKTVLRRNLLAQSLTGIVAVCHGSTTKLFASTPSLPPCRQSWRASRVRGR
jgi:hypothetical protein